MIKPVMHSLAPVLVACLAFACSESQPDVSQNAPPPVLTPTATDAPALADTALTDSAFAAAAKAAALAETTQVRVAVVEKPKAPVVAKPTPEPAAAPVQPPPAPSAAALTPSGNTVRVWEAGSESVVGYVEAGMPLSVTTAAKICTNTSAVGSTVSATLPAPIVGSNGAMIPAASELQFEIVELKRSESVNDKIRIGLRPTVIRVNGESYRIVASVDSVPVTRVKEEGSGATVKKSAVTAVLGFGLAKLLGKSNKEAAAVAAGGATAAAVVAEAGAKVDGCVESGVRIGLHLTERLQLRQP